VSKSTNRPRRRLRARRGDAGFSLIEMTVALLLFAVAAAGTIPLVIGSMRASVVAKYSTQAKNLAQERLEYMRSLPYHVAHQNGLGYVDLLDIHFRDLSAVSTNVRCAGGAGYAAATNTYTCNSGTLAAPYGIYSLSTASQFLDYARTVKTPPSTYNSQTVGADQPVTGLLGVTITITWQQYGASKSYVLFSQIATNSPTEPVLRQQAKVHAVRVSSKVRDAADAESTLQFDAGSFSATGSVETGSEASFNAQGAGASMGDGSSVSGANVVVAAPPTSTGASTTVASGQLGGTCTYVCFGSTTVAGDLKAEITGGNPTVGGTGVAPSGGATATLAETQHNEYAFKFGNGANDPSGLNLVTSEPMVFMTGYPAGPDQTVGAAGFLKATNTPTTHTVTTNGYATASEIDIMPTTNTPVINGRHGGVVRVRLTSAVLGCTTDGTTGTFPGTTWSGGVQYYDVAAGAYSAWIPIVPTAGVDPLAGIDLTTISQGVSSLDGRTLTLADYIDSWDSLTAVTVESSDQTTQASLPGVVNVVTKPTRGMTAAPTTPDTSSVISVKLGELSCLAEDKR
jgi:prepilin-type N-terminal cleavage/methylation domain-containing protein